MPDGLWDALPTVLAYVGSTVIENADSSRLVVNCTD